jgi:hypothetical protein
MKLGRYLFGICSINHFIYVIGGRSNYKSERYDVFLDQWNGIPNDKKLDDFGYGVTVAVVA